MSFRAIARTRAKTEIDVSPPEIGEIMKEEEIGAKEEESRQDRVRKIRYDLHHRSYFYNWSYVKFMISQKNITDANTGSNGTLVALEEAKTSVFQWCWKRQNLCFFTSMADEQIGNKQIGKEKRRMMGEGIEVHLSCLGLQPALLRPDNGQPRGDNFSVRGELQRSWRYSYQAVLSKLSLLSLEVFCWGSVVATLVLEVVDLG
ncbi:hypothetical protein Q3G72_004714 [Acer saccharum]|nr:hypothetical protein Q3G72_004714 [Acer saccharum]